MEGAKISKYIFFALLIILLYLTFRLAQPFITYIFVGIVLTIAMYPIYAWLAKRLKNKKLSSLIVILLILLIIIIPCIIIISALLKQTIGFINTFDPHYFEKINTYLVKGLGPRADLSNNFDQLITNIKDFILKATFFIAGSVADVSIGLFLMFFVIYYCFVEGDAWMANIEDLIPFNKKRKEKLVRKIQEVTKGVIYGHVFIAILEGILGGIGFFTAGISNPVFWGFIITVLALIPFLGANYVLLPAGIIEISKGNVLMGILLLIYGFCIVIGVENILRPHIISGKGRVHPLIVLIGIIGGLKLFGLLGVIIGPLIAALFMTMAGFFYEDYVKVNEKANN